MGITQSQITVIVTFYHEHDMYRATQSWGTTQNTNIIREKKKLRKTSQTISPTLNQTHSTKLTKPMYKHYITQITKITHKSRKQNHNHEIWSEREKAHTFSLKIWGWNDAKWRFFKSNMVSLRESVNGEDNEQSEMFEGKLKSFKNCP